MTDTRPNRVRGPNHDEFWSYCAQDELRLQRCRVCLHLSWPPVEVCERCGSPDLRWQKLSGRGTVVGWCRIEQRYYAQIPVPWDAILVELEEGPLFLSNPAGFSVDDVTPNMIVRLAFIDCEDDGGSFRLPVFEKG